MNTLPTRLRFRTLLLGLSDLIWPRVCALCENCFESERLPGCLCPSCHAVLTSDTAETCPRCAGTIGPYSETTSGCPRCRGTVFHFEPAIRLGYYDGLLREAVLRLKQDSGEPLAEELGEVLGMVRGAALRATRPDVIVPVPLHWRRRWSRGYNQSEAIARGLARALGVPDRSGWLSRNRPTPSQRAQSRQARWENVRGAFRVARSALVQGKRVVLVDDVLTTGATASAAALALKEAGAAQVILAVLAHR